MPRRAPLSENKLRFNPRPTAAALEPARRRSQVTPVFQTVPSVSIDQDSPAESRPDAGGRPASARRLLVERWALSGASALGQNGKFPPKLKMCGQTRIFAPPPIRVKKAVIRNVKSVM